MACTRLLEHLVRLEEEGRGQSDPERFGGLEIDHQLEFHRLLHGQSLVCPEEIAPSDIILVENFDPDHLVFERAAVLQRAGVASRVFVPVPASRDPARPNLVSQGIAEVMARVTRGCRS